MKKINYPSGNKLKKFKDAYIESVQLDKHEAEFRHIISNNIFTPLHNLYRGFGKSGLLTIKELLTLEFEELLQLSLCFIECCSRNRDHVVEYYEYRLCKIFNYDNKGSPSYRDNIANFFREYHEELSLTVCFYCDIEFINAFKDIPYFVDDLKFIRKLSEDELYRIKGIGEKAVTTILAERDVISSFDQLTLKPHQKLNIVKRIVNRTYDHFTLDHVLNKSDHILPALSLFNFIPSCYSCNCKFKGETHLIESNMDVNLSPTSNNFSLDNKLKFKLILYKSAVNTEFGLKDFDVEIDFPKSSGKYEEYVSLFKLKGRYSFHKKEALSLIQKQARYSNSRLEELSKQTGLTVEQIKKDIFGNEIFESDNINKSLTKYKRDIAEELKIKT